MESFKTYWDPGTNGTTGTKSVQSASRRTARGGQLTTGQKAALGIEIEPMLAEEAKSRQSHGKTAPGRTLKGKFPEAFCGQSRDRAAKQVPV